MKQFFVFILMMAIAHFLPAQLIEQFSDGDFTNNPTWQGDTDQYIINAAFEMQLMATGGESSIVIPVQTGDSTAWEFYFRLEFAPSTSNRMQIYLSTNQADISNNTTGYFIQVGDTGSDDALEFFRRDGPSTTLLLATPPGSVATNPAVRVRVIRNQNFDWELTADLTGGNNFTSYGTINDNTYTSGQFFGFNNSYTSTRRDKFFFDDITIGPLFMDQTPPELINLAVENANEITLTFNESLDATSAENVANYSISPLLNITDAALDNGNPSQVSLTVDNISNGIDYTLTTNDIGDMENNISGAQSRTFRFVETMAALPNDIIINEIMADPQPEVGLPPFEFIELFNRSNKFIQLESFSIADANSAADPLGEFILGPGEYLIVCEAANAGSFLPFGPVLGVTSLPAFNNSEDLVSLSDNNGIEINSIRYFNDWYQDFDKASGGWTLELINPSLFCLTSENWIASNNATGGTPGQVNSVLDDTPDTTAPSLESAVALSANQVEVVFSETMDINSLTNPGNYTITPGNLSPGQAIRSGNDQTVLLTFTNPLTDQQAYMLTATGLSDCVGNAISANNVTTFTYFITAPAERYDIIINEIYADFTPSHGLPELEYLELFNRSDKAINLQNYVLFDGSGDGSTLPFFVLEPGGYVILQEASASEYSDYGATIELNNMSLSNAADDLILYDNNGQVIDAVSYSSSWYFDDREEGYALERINPDVICSNTAVNWSSSFANIGGTPGAVNDILDSSVSDETGATLLKVYMDRLTPNQAVLSFDKSLEETIANDPDTYAITPSDLTINNISLLNPFLNIVLITFNESATTGTIYTIEVSEALESCSGNQLETQTGRFAISEPVEPNDLVLNEILHNPYSGGSRFIEIYNRSEKVVDAADLFLAKRLGPDTIVSDEAVEIPCLIFPGDYIVFTPKPEDILARYQVEFPTALISTGVPSYDDRADIVVLMTNNSLVIDELAYDRTFHNALLDDRNGVSLERINTETKTQSIGNWASAAATIGFATPTYKNSQATDLVGNPEGADILSIPETIFSPDEDGFQDILSIFYKTPRPNFLANINIYDVRGRLVKKLVEQQLLAAEGIFKWDGATDEGQKARIGIYVLVAEFTNPDGTVEQNKETIVVAGRLDN